MCRVLLAGWWRPFCGDLDEGFASSGTALASGSRHTLLNNACVEELAVLVYMYM